MGKKKRNEVLLVGDELDVHARLRGELRAKEYEVTSAVEGKEGLARALRSRFDVVISEVEAPGLSGLDLLRRLRPVKPSLPVILLSAAGGSELRIEASRLGAFDVLAKPFDLSELVRIVDHALSTSRVDVPPLESAPDEFTRNGLVGASAIMRELYKRVGVAADSEETVLITGPSGTGKELIANAIHQHSGRKGHFVPVNCGAIPDSLFESHMFGHEKGAFTGADGRQIGLFEQAHQERFSWMRLAI
jgi:DNA-binding NtrC family response regulator